MKNAAKKVAGLASNIKFWAVLVAGVVTIYSGAAYFGVNLPRVAWSSEVRVVEADLLTLDITVTEREFKNVTLLFYQNQREQTKYRDNSKPVPDFLLNEQTLLETERNRLENRLRNLRDRAAKR